MPSKNLCHNLSVCSGFVNFATSKSGVRIPLSPPTESCKSKDLQDFFIIILACPSKRDSGFALAIELDDKGKGLVDWKEV